MAKKRRYMPEFADFEADAMRSALINAMTPYFVSVECPLTTDDLIRAAFTTHELEARATLLANPNLDVFKEFTSVAFGIEGVEPGNFTWPVVYAFKGGAVAMPRHWGLITKGGVFPTTHPKYEVALMWLEQVEVLNKHIAIIADTAKGLLSGHGGACTNLKQVVRVWPELEQVMRRACIKPPFNDLVARHTRGFLDASSGQIKKARAVGINNKAAEVIRSARPVLAKINMLSNHPKAFSRIDDQDVYVGDII